MSSTHGHHYAPNDFGGRIVEEVITKSPSNPSDTTVSPRSDGPTSPTWSQAPLIQSQPPSQHVYQEGVYQVKGRARGLSVGHKNDVVPVLKLGRDNLQPHDGLLDARRQMTRRRTVSDTKAIR